jgi:hypothetical protein
MRHSVLSGMGSPEIADAIADVAEGFCPSVTSPSSPTMDASAVPVAAVPTGWRARGSR